MKITVENGTAKIFTPYNKEFVAKIKNIGGRKWNGSERCWEVPESEIEIVREYMQECFGQTDTEAAEKLRIKLTFTKMAIANREGVAVFGKTIAKASGRDSGARVGDDATFISGEIESGGSAKNWTTIVNEGTSFIVRNIPKKALDIESDYDFTYEVLESEINKEELLAEKEKLLARLQEIEKLLA